jgi:ATP-dependent RNA helicase DDX54/DBP10
LSIVYHLDIIFNHRSLLLYFDRVVANTLIYLLIPIERNIDEMAMTSSASSSKGKAPAGSFQSMDLNKELLSGLSRMGYRVPTPVQRKALPIALAGMDVVCMSRTGSGKTCVFLLPLFEKLHSHDGSAGVRAVVLSPTR